MRPASSARSRSGVAWSPCSAVSPRASAFASTCLAGSPLSVSRRATASLCRGVSRSRSPTRRRRLTAKASTTCTTNSCSSTAVRRLPSTTTSAGVRRLAGHLDARQARRSRPGRQHALRNCGPDLGRLLELHFARFRPEPDPFGERDHPNRRLADQHQQLCQRRCALGHLLHEMHGLAQPRRCGVPFDRIHRLSDTGVGRQTERPGECPRERSLHAALLDLGDGQLHPHGRCDRLQGGVSRCPSLDEAPELTDRNPGPFGERSQPFGVDLLTHQLDEGTYALKCHLDPATRPFLVVGQRSTTSAGPSPTSRPRPPAPAMVGRDGLGPRPLGWTLAESPLPRSLGTSACC